MHKDLHELLNQLGIKPHTMRIYETAFTHSSHNADAHTRHHDYERLEFLGDSILGFVVASLAFKHRLELSQGDLTKLKSSLVSTKSLANLARKYNFHEYIRVGNSFSNDLSKSDSILEDVFEAFIAALYLDRGIKDAGAFIEKTFIDLIKAYDVNDSKDYKSRLQEEMQAEYRESVTYQLLKESGPPHNRHFRVCVKFEDIVLGYGEGSTKKEAEINAAKDALAKKASIK